MKKILAALTFQLLFAGACFAQMYIRDVSESRLPMDPAPKQKILLTDSNNRKFCGTWIYHDKDTQIKIALKDTIVTLGNVVAVHQLTGKYTVTMPSGLVYHYQLNGGTMGKNKSAEVIMHKPDTKGSTNFVINYLNPKALFVKPGRPFEWGGGENFLQLPVEITLHRIY